MDGKKLLRDRVERDFTYHPPTTEEKKQKYVTLREKGKELALLIVELCPASREQSVALTELETAIMFANAAIARND